MKRDPRFKRDWNWTEKELKIDLKKLRVLNDLSSFNDKKDFVIQYKRITILRTDFETAVKIFNFIAVLDMIINEHLKGK